VNPCGFGDLMIELPQTTSYKLPSTNIMQVKIGGMEFFAYHGLLPEETMIGGKFMVEMLIETDFTKAAENDDIEGTVNYSEVYDLTAKEMAVPSKLIEHVAKRIKDAVLKNIKNINYIQVTVIKLRPPVNGVMQRVSVTI
jgi:7,8-dihydroneopterin aldolase/epimerase/oxygenase